MKGTGLALAIMLAMSGTALAEIRVSASIAPIHSLAARVMRGAGAPDLIVRPGASPHGYSLKPSEAAALDAADVVFWVGETLEPWMEGPLEALASDARIVEVAEIDGLVQLETREGGAWEVHEHGHEHERDEEGHAEEHAQEDHAHEGLDPHLWLDPVNAGRIVAAMAAALAEADPENAALYRANAEAARGELDALAAEIDATLAPVRGRPYIVFHDAYHYFEARFELGAVGSIALSDAEKPSPSRVLEIRERLAETGAVCVFVEPQFSDRLAQTVIEGSSARVGRLDPIGAEIPPGSEHYPALIRALAASLADCLSQ